GGGRVPHTRRRDDEHCLWRAGHDHGGHHPVAVRTVGTARLAAPGASASWQMTFSSAAERSVFQSAVEEWFSANAPRKGSPEDFSAVHIVTVTSVTEYEAAERAALETSRAWQKKLYAAGLAGRSWPAACGGHNGPAWQDQVIAEVQSRYGVSTKF